MNSRKNGSHSARSHVGIVADERRIARAFGIALRSARERRELSLEQLAERGGLDRAYPSLLERGLQDPSLCDLLRVSVAIGIAPGQLLEDTIAAYAGQALARTDVIRLREIWLAFAGTLAQCSLREPVATAVLGARLLVELARHGLTIVSLPVELHEGHGHT
jgi:transcriptional regulator with XRE-family HTH domain